MVRGEADKNPRSKIVDHAIGHPPVINKVPSPSLGLFVCLTSFRRAQVDPGRTARTDKCITIQPVRNLISLGCIV